MLHYKAVLQQCLQTLSVHAATTVRSAVTEVHHCESNRNCLPFEPFGSPHLASHMFKFSNSAWCAAPTSGTVIVDFCVKYVADV